MTHAPDPDLMDDEDLNDEEWDEEWDDDPSPADLGIPLPSGSRDPYARQDPGVSAWSASDVRGMAPIFDGAVGDAVLDVEVQKPDGTWSLMGTFPARLSRDGIIQQVQKSGVYRVQLLGPDRKPVSGQRTTFQVDEDNATLRKVRAQAQGGAPGAFPHAAMMAGGGNTLEEIRQMMREEREAAARQVEAERRLLEAERRRIASLEDRVAAKEAEANQQQMAAAEILSNRQVELMQAFQEKSAESQNNQFTSMATMMQQQMQMMQMQHEQTVARMREERLAEERRREDERRREREDAERRMEQIRLEAEQQRERERARMEAEQRAWEERQRRREEYERQLADRRERLERQDAEERRAREEREREREERRLTEERAQAREDRRFREEREQKLLEVQQKSDPLGATVGTITTIVGLLSQLGIEPGDMIKQVTSGAKGSAMADVFKEALGVVKAGIEAGAQQGMMEDDDDDDTEILMLPDGQGGQQAVQVTAAQAATLRQQAQAAGAAVNPSQGQAFQQAPMPQAPPSADYAQPTDYVIRDGQPSQAAPAPAPNQAAPAVDAAARLRAELGQAPAPAPAPEQPTDPIRVTRTKITDYVQTALTRPESEWAMSLMMFLGQHPDVLAYLRQVGIKPALRDAGADEATIDKVVTMVQTSGMNSGDNAIPYGD